ncbi:MAG: DUF748 domain-containing protein [Syntrophorhabdaceae bacterium]|nr:DUF748 domain-containing protein [Syntrophorhabdaceae bacterium]
MTKKKRLFFKIFLALFIIFIIFTVTGFFIAPPILKSLLVKNISKALQREVSIGKIDINPFNLTIRIKGINIKEKGKNDTMFSFEELFVNAESASIFKRALILKEITIKNPYINIVRNKDGSYNFSDLIEMSEKEKEKESGKTEEKKKKPFYFSIHNISLINGAIDFYDGPFDTKHTLREMNIKVPFISNFSHHVNNFIQPYFSAKINDDIYEIKGDAKPFAESREANIDINIQDLDIPKYLSYFPVKIHFKLLSGSLDVATRISFIEYKDKPPALVISGNVIVRELAGDDLQKKLLFRLPKIELDLKSIEPFKKSLAVSRVFFQSPEVSIQREKDGTLNIQKLFEEKKIEKEKAQKKEMDSTRKTEKKRDDEKELALNIEELAIKNGKVTFNDLTPSQPVNALIKNIDLKLDNLSLEKNHISNLLLSFVFDKGGVIKLKGPFKINPVHLDMGVDIKNIYINPFQPYFTDRININITDGALTTSGKFIIDISEKTGTSIKYNGKILVSNLATIDKANAEPLLNWKAFSIDNLNFHSNPLSVHVEGISLTDFFAKVTVNPDGRLNLQNIMVEEEKPKETKTQEQPPSKEEKPKEPDKDIKIGNITLQGGTIEFTDKAIQPNYTATLTEIAGKVSDIALKGDSLAELTLRGKINQFVPLEIAGKINPAKENLLVDLYAKFNSLDLSPFTPYSGKYMGYKIDKGKLSIDLKYLIEKRKLDSQNVIFIDQLTLGDKVDSPDATKLPVRLAIALLKDRNGQIKLDIPVSGSLDDPKFSIWRIVLQVIINLLTKAATAPFALLGSLFGGGEEISYIEFDYGESKVSEQNMKKIENLAKALFERPSLKLDIQGHVDVEKDRESLKKIMFLRKLKTQKLNELIKKGEKAIPLDDVKIEPAEYEKYLKTAYDAEKFAKPKTPVGTAKILPPNEMEKLIYTHIDVTDNDLRTLANQRAASVKEMLLKTEKVTLDRVFILEPKTLGPEKKDKVKDSRVDFILK